MKVLVVGGGAREHALCWALRRGSVSSPGATGGGASSVTELLCAPGNAGIAELARTFPIAADEVGRIADLADAEDVELVVVGPEVPLVAGLADLLRARGRAVFGCSRAAAEIEGSKAFSKDLLIRYGIPTAAYGVFSELGGADLFIDAQFGEGASRLVVKADGLAAGKGVELCDSPSAAKAAVRRMLERRELGEAGSRVVIEEFLQGREASIMALVQGETVVPLPAAEDHKAVFDGDAGPMTGGMGVVTPTPVVDDVLYARIVRDVLEPTARAMVREGRPFSGLLYAGVMVTERGPAVLEFNCRFGDPETQPLMLRLEDDLATVLHAVARGGIPSRVRFSPHASVCVVLAAGGYPGAYHRGQVISGLTEAERLPGVVVFHAGTERVGEELVTAGGRVLGVTALGADVDEARRRAYAAVETISFEGMHYRRDIGARSEGA